MQNTPVTIISHPEYGFSIKVGTRLISNNDICNELLNIKYTLSEEDRLALESLEEVEEEN